MSLPLVRVDCLGLYPVRVVSPFLLTIVSFDSVVLFEQCLRGVSELTVRLWIGRWAPREENS
jgi:hypothetical protein